MKIPNSKILLLALFLNEEEKAYSVAARTAVYKLAPDGQCSIDIRIYSRISRQNSLEEPIYTSR